MLDIEGWHIGVSTELTWKSLHTLLRCICALPQAPDQEAFAGDGCLIHRARARRARARANVDRQQAQAIPNVALLVGAGHDDGTNSGMLNTRIGLRLPIHNKNLGNISAAQAEFCRASQDLRRTALAIESRLAEVTRDFELSAVVVQQYYEEILPRAEETLRLAEAVYNAGEFDFLQVLIVRRTFFDANLEFVAAQVSLGGTGLPLNQHIRTVPGNSASDFWQSKTSLFGAIR